ncbi:amidohydrolase family protein [Catellatospora chokoriensis]|uniref:Amidohydrolase 3 domain-containing protein n=1 Tax=Catellatospora chokoriensis TaxID=310353 RepID=A0A8J3NVD8_9ACTN|nr:amidohydrolase family protein [Catellatospora chokoriensis]GIF93882.1 hypothetical protein Cch02nite_73260 [Catellatospora chokoriensis]
MAGAAASTPAGAWIRGRNWSELRLERPPTRHDLDPLTGDRPVILTDFTLHAVTCTSAALRMAGITASVTAPACGVIERDPQCEPACLLREGATALLQAVVPHYTTVQLRHAITAAAAALAADGVTSITEPSITAQLLDLYDELACGGGKGILAPGRAAGLCVLSADLYAVDPARHRTRPGRRHGDGPPGLPAVLRCPGAPAGCRVSRTGDGGSGPRSFVTLVLPATE